MQMVDMYIYRVVEKYFYS
uniref:Uncharacterized protein n=1 Tax=Rhizophora mucronata TaxID=61149 RepID=A0A2P2PTN9_RHIMU